MTADTGEFRALAEEVAELREEVRILREQAFMLRTIEEIERIYADVAAGRRRPLSRTLPRPAYLRVVNGGES